MFLEIITHPCLSLYNSGCHIKLSYGDIKWCRGIPNILTRSWDILSWRYIYLSIYIYLHGRMFHWGSPCYFSGWWEPVQGCPLDRPYDDSMGNQPKDHGKEMKANNHQVLLSQMVSGVVVWTSTRRGPYFNLCYEAYIYNWMLMMGLSLEQNLLTWRTVPSYMVHLQRLSTGGIIWLLALPTLMYTHRVWGISALRVILVWWHNI